MKLTELGFIITSMENQMSNRNKVASIKRKVSRLVSLAEQGRLSDRQTFNVRRIFAQINSEDRTAEEVEEILDETIEEIEEGEDASDVVVESSERVTMPSNKEPQWSLMSLQDVEDLANQTYGDLGKNETFYVSRKKKLATKEPQWSLMTLEEAEAHADSVYGDQGKNETFYTSRRKSEASRDNPWADGTYDYHIPHREQLEGEGEFFGVDDWVDADGFDAMDMNQMPEVVEDAHEAWNTLKGASLRKDLLTLGQRNPKLRVHIAAVLDRI